MAMHDIHTSETAVFDDGCKECQHRAEQGAFGALAYCDGGNTARLFELAAGLLDTRAPEGASRLDVKVARELSYLLIAARRMPLAARVQLAEVVTR